MKWGEIITKWNEIKLNERRNDMKVWKRNESIKWKNAMKEWNEWMN